MGKRYWEWKPVFRLNRSQVGLLIIDMQNGFLEEGAPLEVPQARSQVPAIKRLLDFFRQERLRRSRICCGSRHRRSRSYPECPSSTSITSLELPHRVDRQLVPVGARSAPGPR